MVSKLSQEYRNDWDEERTSIRHRVASVREGRKTRKDKGEAAKPNPRSSSPQKRREEEASHSTLPISTPLAIEAYKIDTKGKGKQ